MERPLKVLIFGPYGGVNLGDDYIAHSLISKLQNANQKYELTLTIIDNNLSFNHFNNLNFIDYPHIRFLNFKVFQKINFFDIILIGGGQQLSEPRLINPFWGLISNVFWVSCLSKLYGKKFLVMSVGVGYPLTFFGRYQVSIIIKFSDYFSVRDLGSQKELNSIFKKEIKISKDLAFFYEKKDLIKIFRLSANVLNTTKVSFVPNINLGINNIECLISSIINDYNLSELNILFSDKQKNIDLKLIKKLSSNEFGPKLKFIVPTNLDSLIKEIYTSKILITSRMHPLIIAKTIGTDFKLVTKQQKIIEFCKIEKITPFNIKLQPLPLENYGKLKFDDIAKTLKNL